MTLPTEPTIHPLSSVGGGSGEFFGGERVAALDPFLYQDSHWCGNCGGPQTFIPLYECDFGRVGFCLGCGKERVARFTRTTGEAA